jgi:hypothetical protein
MSSKRIFFLSGKPNTITNVSTYGTTIQDEQTVPNLIRHTLVPAMGSIQTDIISMGVAISGPVTTAQTISPDFVFVNTFVYQVNIDLTIFIVIGNQSSYSQKHFLITCDIRPAGGVNTTLGIVGINYVLQYKEDGIDAQIKDEDVVVSLIGNRLIVTVTPYSSIENSLNIFGEFKIRCFSFGI